MSLIEKTIEQYHTRRYPGIAQYIEIPLRLKIIRRMVDAATSKIICDLGCSDGILGELLIKDGHKVFGIDVSSPALKIAKRRKVKTYKRNLEADNLPFANESLDAVVSSETLASIYDTDRLLDEIRRVLKKDGLLIITAANTLSLGRRLNYLFGRGVFLETGLRGRSSGTIHYFTKSSLIGLLQRHQFEPVKFESDYINIGEGGTIRLRVLARIFPTLGSSLIICSRKIN